MKNPAKHSQKIIFMLSCTLFVFFSFLYLAFSPSLSHQNWDSLWYCYACEIGGITKIPWGNHPLVHPILCSIFKLVTFLGYSDKALPVLKVVNSIIGGITVSVLLVVLYNVIKFGLLNSLGCATIFGATYGIWHYAGTAEIYNFSALLLIASWTFQIYEVSSNRNMVFSGILSGLAILAHQLNGVLLLVGLIPILKNCEYKQVKKKLSTFLLSAALTAATGYLALWSLQTPATFSLRAMILWTIGYGTDPSFGKYLQFENLLSAVYTAGKVFINYTNGSRISSLAWCGVCAVVLLLVFWGVMENRRLNKIKKALLLSSLMQCVIGGLLILWWQPHNEKFWVLILFPWIITLACSIEAVGSAVQSLWPKLKSPLVRSVSVFPLLLGIFMILFNANYRMLKERQPNMFLQQSIEQWLSHSGPNDLLITTINLVPYLRFWAGRPNAINIYDLLRDNPDRKNKFEWLRAAINNAFQRNCSVLFSIAIIEPCSDDNLIVPGVTCKDLRSFLENYEWNEVVFYYPNLINGESIPVFRIIHKDSFKTRN